MLFRIHTERLTHRIPMERFYTLVKISRQAFFDRLKRRQILDDIRTSIIPRVLDYRAHKDSRAGSRSLYKNLDVKTRYNIGINKFEQLMAFSGLTLRPLRTKVVTTQSCHQSWNYSNLINGIEVTDTNQVVVGDLTYVNIESNRYYVFCLTDVYSARIVGLEISKRMRSEEALTCLSQWINLRGKDNLQGCIHHTDGGSQYFSKKYLEVINGAKIQISVAGNCLENGYAEQKNNLTKNHLIPTINYMPGMNISKEIKRKKRFFNYERKQEKLNWMTPVEFEQKWNKNKNRPKIKLHDFEK